MTETVIRSTDAKSADGSHFKSASLSRYVLITDVVYLDEPDLLVLKAEAAAAMEQLKDKIDLCKKKYGDAPSQLRTAFYHTCSFHRRVKDELKIRSQPVQPTAEEQIELEKLRLEKERVKRERQQERLEVETLNSTKRTAALKANAERHQLHQTALAAKEYQIRKQFWKLLCERYGTAYICELRSRAKRFVEDQGINYVDLEM